MIDRRRCDGTATYFALFPPMVNVLVGSPRLLRAFFGIIRRRSLVLTPINV